MSGEPGPPNRRGRPRPGDRERLRSFGGDVASISPWSLDRHERALAEFALAAEFEAGAATAAACAAAHLTRAAWLAGGTADEAANAVVALHERLCRAAAEAVGRALVELDSWPAA